MRRFLGLIAFACLLIGSVSGTLVHATEIASIEGPASMHADGDGDQVPADGHAPTPHHHGACHGHELAALIKLSAPRIALLVSTLPVSWRDAAFVAIPPRQTLRPPIA